MTGESAFGDAAGSWLGAFDDEVRALFFGDPADRIGRRRVFVLTLVAFVGLALLLRRSLPDSPRWLLAQGRVENAVAAFEQFGVGVLDLSRLPAAPARRVAAPGLGPRVRGWLEPYARLFTGPGREAVVFAILMIGLIPLNGIGQSVLTAPVLHQFGHLSKVGSILAGSVIWIRARARQRRRWPGAAGPDGGRPARVGEESWWWRSSGVDYVGRVGAAPAGRRAVVAK